MKKQEEIRYIKDLLVDVFEKYANACNLIHDIYTFSFYWFKTPIIPHHGYYAKTTLKIYAQKSNSEDPIVIYKDTISFIKENEEEKTYLMWKKMLDKILIHGLQNMYNNTVITLDLEKEYPLQTVHL